MKAAMTAAVFAVLALPMTVFAQNTAPQTGSAQHEWQASKLLHLNVYNDNNEKIGEIKELMLDNAGNIHDAVISVGGFLGLGQRDVAVKFDQLTWVNKAMPSATLPITGSGPATPGVNTGPISGAQYNYPDHAQLNMSKDQLMALPPFDYAK